ncbi:MAG: ATP-binding protein [Methylococcaceae bacterium]|nr:ATP-binding protein [Methylococcaceae bacterium]
MKDPQADLIYTSALPEAILPSIAIYGANASGKTNMIEALKFFVEFIRNSYRKAETSGIHRPVFKLNADAKDETSDFDMDFVLGGIHYHYGFKINDKAVMEEWLFSYSYENRKSRKVLFHRNRQEENEYKFSKYLKAENKVIARLTRDNSLFLSTAAQNNHELLSEIQDYFLRFFLFRFDQELSTKKIANAIKKIGVINQVNNFLKNSGAGIEGIKLKIKIPRENDLLIKQSTIALIDAFHTVRDDRLEGIIDSLFDDARLELSHKDQNGNLVLFELEEESLGTKAMIALLTPAFKALNQGGIFIVDEIESSLHALLTLQVIKLFNHKATNPNGAQLLFTTHETHILCSNLLRRDQIWFSEKNLNGETVIAPLTDYQLRSTDNIQKGYLEGRFGAIPFLGDIQQLFQREKTVNG